MKVVIGQNNDGCGEGMAGEIKISRYTPLIHHFGLVPCSFAIDKSPRGGYQIWINDIVKWK